MLSYAFHVLNEKGYNKIATDDFENTADLFNQARSLQGLYSI